MLGGQLVVLSKKNDQLQDTIETLSQKVEILTGQVKEFSSKSKKEKFAAVDVSTKLQELHTAVMDKRALKEKENVVTFNKLETKYELVLPFLNLEEFTAFEIKLQEASLAADLVIIKMNILFFFNTEVVTNL